MWKTGHSLIKAKMKELSASLAGEMSGHIFFADKYYGFDDALYASIRLINILANSSQSLAQMRQELPKTFSTAEIRIETSEEKKFAIVEDLKNLLHKNNEKFVDIDGIRAQSSEGWWLIRASSSAALRTSSSPIWEYRSGVIRMLGPAIAMPATTRRSVPRMGAPMAIRPGSISSTEMP